MRCYLLAAGLLALLLTPVYAEDTPDSVSQLTLEDLRTFTDVFEQIRSNYIDEIGDAQLLRAAIRGMLSETDGYSTFIDENEFRALDQNTRGRVGGVGALVMIQKRMLVVNSVQKDGPADLAGIGAGDRIISVDGRPVRGRPLSESIEAINGEPGSTLKLKVLSRDQEPRELELTREWIQVASVSSEWLEDGIAKISISHFHQNTHTEFHDQLGQLRSSGQTLKGLSSTCNRTSVVNCIPL